MLNNNDNKKKIVGFCPVLSCVDIVAEILSDCEEGWVKILADVKELLLELISQVSSLLEEEELGLPRATQVIKKAWRSLFCNIQIFEEKNFF